MENNYTYKDKIRWFKLIKIILSKKKRWRLAEVIYYALNTYEERRGEGSSDVMIFDHMFSDKLIKRNKNG